MTKQARCHQEGFGGWNECLPPPPLSPTKKKKPNGQWEIVQTQNVVRRKWKEWQRGKIM